MIRKTFFPKALLRYALLLSVASLTHLISAATPHFPKSSWQKAEITEAKGWDREKLAEADALAKELGTSSYMIIQGGKVIHEFGDTSAVMNIYSIRKSILTVLMGIEYDQGKVDLSKSLADLKINDKQGLTKQELRATVEELMQARSGVFHPAAYETANMAKRRPARDSHRPGTHWYYNNWDFNALATIYEKFSGQDYFKALEAELAKPLGFEDYIPARHGRWQLEDASDHPAYVTYLSTRDLARIGLMLARNGKWHNKQILSSKFIDKSIQPYSKNVEKNLDYGYMWWVGSKGQHYNNTFKGTVYTARGNHGQSLLINPEQDLVIVHRLLYQGEGTKRMTYDQIGELLKVALAAWDKSPRQ